MAPTGHSPSRRRTHVTTFEIRLSKDGGSVPCFLRRLSSWVGRWRGTLNALFHRPPTKLYVHLSMHTAFRSFIPKSSVVLVVLYGSPDDRDGKQPGSFSGGQPWF